MSAPQHVTDRPIVLPWWQRKRTRRLAVSIAVLLTLIFGLVVSRHGIVRTTRADWNLVSVATVQVGAYHDYLPLRAHAVALNTVYLDAQQGGRVEHVYAQAGDSVTQGELLVELSNSQLELDVLEREARLVESVSQLESYQTQLEQNRVANARALAAIEYDITRLRRSLGRRKLLAMDRIEPAETLDLVSDELDYDLRIQPLQDESNHRQEQLRLEQIPQIAEQLKSLQQDLRITHAQLDKLSVRAPMTGRLTAMNAQTGENRNLGDRLGELTADAGFRLNASVDEYYIGRVRKGQSAVVSIRDRDYPLTVTRIYPQVKEGSFSIDLDFSGPPPPDLTVGENIQGKLTLGGDQSGLILPSGPFLDRTGGDWVYVVNTDRTAAARRHIRIGRRNTEQLEVLSGLHSGEEVLISNYETLGDVDRVVLLH
jgi:HlyD family secretion protein